MNFRRLFRPVLIRLEYLGFLLVAGIMRALPVETASQLMGLVWRTIAPRLHRQKRAMANLARAFPEKTESERRAIALAMWEGLGRIFAEFFHLEDLIESNRLTFASMEHFHELTRPGQGSVACSAHMGNWELTVALALRLGASPCGLYRQLSNPLIDAYVRNHRARFYPGGLFEKAGSPARKIIRMVEKGGLLAIMADLREGRGLNVPFFGYPAPSTPFPAMIARQLDVRLYAAHVIRGPGVTFTLDFEDIPVPHTENRAADIEAATAALQAAFERRIRLHPEQWMWGHRRWG